MNENKTNLMLESKNKQQNTHAKIYTVCVIYCSELKTKNVMRHAKNKVHFNIATYRVFVFNSHQRFCNINIDIEIINGVKCFVRLSVSG